MIIISYLSAFQKKKKEMSGKIPTYTSSPYSPCISHNPHSIPTLPIPALRPPPHPTFYPPFPPTARRIPALQRSHYPPYMLQRQRRLVRVRGFRVSRRERESEGRGDKRDLARDMETRGDEHSLGVRTDVGGCPVTQSLDVER